MELFGSESFKRAAWLEAQRAGITVTGYEAPADLLRQWEQEHLRMSPGGAVAAVKESAQAAQLLKRAAAGDAEAGRQLPHDLRAFLYGYGAGNGRQLAALANAEIGDLVSELGRLRYYGNAWLDPVATGGSLAAWADGDETAPAPGCPQIARMMREALAAGRSSDESAMEALAVLGVAKGGEVRTAEELARVVDQNARRAAGRTSLRQGEQGASDDVKPKL